VKDDCGDVRVDIAGVTPATSDRRLLKGRYMQTVPGWHFALTV
jgi:hypothetical protein